MTWPTESGEGTRNTGVDGKGAAASSGRNAVIAQTVGEGEKNGERMREAAGEAGHRGRVREA